MTLDEFRKEYPVLKTAFILAKELLDRTNPANASGVDIGPTFDELLDVARLYLERRVRVVDSSDRRDIGIYYWRLQALNRLETAIRSVGYTDIQAVPVLGNPDHLDTEYFRRFQWTGVIAAGKKCHTNKLPCHTELERQFADFLDMAPDVLRYLKNERFGFSITYYENGRPRQYYPDFIAVIRGKEGPETYWLVETKGEIRQNTALKQEAAQMWCEKLSSIRYGKWRYLFVQQRTFEQAITSSIQAFEQLVEALVAAGMTLRK